MGAAAAVSGLAEGRVTGDAELTLYTLSPWAKPRPARSLHRTTSWWLVRSYLLLKMPVSVNLAWSALSPQPNLATLQRSLWSQTNAVKHRPLAEADGACRLDALAGRLPRRLDASRI